MKRPDDWILVAVNLDSASKTVMEHAVTMAARLGMGLCMVHVVAKNAIEPRDACERMASLAGREATLHVETRIVSGAVVPAILAVGTELQPDYLVLGGSLSPRPNGSVAERIVRRSPWPVVVIPLPVGALELPPREDAKLRRLAAQLTEAKRLTASAIADESICGKSATSSGA
ncbi:MAG: universal stress protein [Myxococcota bacterium]